MWTAIFVCLFVFNFFFVSFRKLAHQQGVPWSEFWEFLNCSCDLSKETGRRVLDEYLKGVWSEAGSQSGSDLSSPKLDDVDWSSMDEELSALVESKLSLQESEFSTPQIRRGQPIASCNFLTGWVCSKLVCHWCSFGVVEVQSLSWCWYK